jgi:hypothetical protein
MVMWPVLANEWVLILAAKGSHVKFTRALSGDSAQILLLSSIPSKQEKFADSALAGWVVKGSHPLQLLRHAGRLLHPRQVCMHLQKCCIPMSPPYLAVNLLNLLVIFSGHSLPSQYLCPCF